MNRAARTVLRKLGHDQSLDEERQQRMEREFEERQKQATENRDEAAPLESVPEEMLSESEKRHASYRRRQAMGGRFTPAAERLPIMTADQRKERDKDRPNWNPTSFEGPIEKLIEKYGDLEEVKKHLTLGQSMKYEFADDGRVLDSEGKVIYDGEKLV